MSVLVLPAWLAGTVVTLAWCWRIERADGVVIGFTTHDHDFVRDGVRFRAAPGIAPSAIRLTGDRSGDAMEIAGALTGAALSADDLESGRWDGARVTLSVVDWEDEAQPAVLLASGTLGAVERSGDQFSAELRGPVFALDGPIVPRTAPGCRARLGDRDCRIDLAGRRHRAIATAIDGRNVTLDRSFADGILSCGQLRWVDGPGAGTGCAILSHDGDRIELLEAIGWSLAEPLGVALVEGCDGMLSTCSARFGNAVNFRGEPHLPGNDLLTRYPNG